MKYWGSKLKKLEKKRFLWYFYHLNGVKSKYKGLPIENIIGSSYLLEFLKFYKLH